MKEMILETRIKTYLPSELPDELKELARLSLLAARNAYAPYSKFQVGAAVWLENGMIITGNNQENVAYPSGLCAERVALFYAGAQYPDVAVCAIAISAQTEGEQVELITPCGACRQVLLETETRHKHPMKVILCGRAQICIAESAASLLPLSFNG